MEKAVFLIDNSNIYVETINSQGREGRLSYPSLEKKFYGKCKIAEKIIAGSKPPANDSIWEKWSEMATK